MTYHFSLTNHYKNNWSSTVHIIDIGRGPIKDVRSNFKVLEFPPYQKREMWTYATAGMASLDDANPVELHIFSEEQNQSIAEILAAIAYFNITTQKLNLWHTMNFGRPWAQGSLCDHGLISLPYLDGPSVENFKFRDRTIKLYWLIPIAKDEQLLKAKQGIESLERLFGKTDFNYLDPSRKVLYKYQSLSCQRSIAMM